VVGVVADVLGHDTRAAEPTIYIPIAQARDVLLQRQQTLAPLRWIVRTSADPRMSLPRWQRGLERAAPGTAVMQMTPMSEFLAEQLSRPGVRFRNHVRPQRRTRGSNRPVDRFAGSDRRSTPTAPVPSAAAA
jgi:hypothetical protein